MTVQKKMPRKCCKHFEALTGSICSGRNQHDKFNGIAHCVQRRRTDGSA